MANQMDYRTLGRTGLKVSALAFGCGDVGGLMVRGAPADRERAIARAVELGIDPLSILVPFLIFSIGVSHAVQMTKTWEREVVAGADSLTAARRAFAKIFIPGTLALATNVLGFAVIMMIPIDIVRELGITASLGVGWMILTNKMLLPVLLSHLTLSKGALQKEAYQESKAHRIWQAAARCVGRRRARTIIGLAVLILLAGLYQAHNLKVGDYGIGVPELTVRAPTLVMLLSVVVAPLFLVLPVTLYAPP